MKDRNEEQKQINERDLSRGKTTIAPDVLVTIARLTALSVTGVSRMGNTPKSANRIFVRSAGEGVRLDIKDDSVFVDLHVILEHGVNIRDVSRSVQQRVNRSISEMVGMRVGRVNVHIEDIDFQKEQESD